MLICEYFYFTKKLHKLCLIDICIRHYSTQQKAFYWWAHCAHLEETIGACLLPSDITSKSIIPLNIGLPVQCQSCKFTMASKEGESSSGSSTASIELSVLGSHESRSMSTQPEGDFETFFISSDSSSSGNSEITNRTESTQDPLMFESQSTESSNLGTQAEDPSSIGTGAFTPKRA